MSDKKQRLSPEVFDLPITEIRAGYRSASYFWRTKMIMEAEKPSKQVTMQIFQKGNSVLCGIDEAIGILKTCSGSFLDNDKAWDIFQSFLLSHKEARKNTVPYEPSSIALKHRQKEVMFEQQLDDLWVPGWDQLEVNALYDGDEIVPWEPVMTITGPYSLFAHLESVYLGVLARRTKIATNTRRVCDAANGKPMLFFADRFDHFATQGGDGYAAKIGGASGFATDAMAAWWGEKGMGTIPHALIAAYDGDTVEATKAFTKHYGHKANVVALVDFNNNCVRESLACAEALGDQLWGVRLDTSESMIDESLMNSDLLGDFKPTGVNPRLVFKVRNVLNDAGYSHVKIIVSGGFNPEKISMFEQKRAPVDSYAVGSSLLQGSGDFTADIVDPVSKKGRWARDTTRLELVS